MEFQMSALPRLHHCGRPGRPGRHHARRHGPVTSHANCAAAIGAVEMPGRMRRVAHHAHRQIGPARAGQLGRLLAADQSDDAAHFLPAHARPSSRFCHHVRLLPLLRRQGRRTTGSIGLQGNFLFVFVFNWDVDTIFEFLSFLI